ncbi:HAMP domain-containing histidine kinase [Paucibacter sp. B2R-40]|uniref:sensor histidine kinase n=1 Tax=Paucibacter sp. B2R-40 TaxID=2893554 RepID=UPI0021E4CCDE|nr:HAMP domain-containing sensor histidine kinase [Paucibacter sp. B2R-40]MCV2352987.1 HAMP domain-containing histidine kinase [Paucibacter sp. B2R-40]
MTSVRTDVSDAEVDGVYTAAGSYRMSEALQLSRALVGSYPDSQRCKFLQSWLGLRLGEQAAPELLQQAESLEQDLTLDPMERAELLLLLAVRRMAQGLTLTALKNEGEALALFEHAGRKVGECMAAWQMLVHLISIGDLDEVERLQPLLERRLLGRYDWADAVLAVGRASAAYGRAEAGDKNSRSTCIAIYRDLYERSKQPALCEFRRMVGTNLAVNCALGGEFELAQQLLSELELLDAGVNQVAVITMHAWRAYTHALVGLRDGHLDLAAVELTRALQLENKGQRGANLQSKILEAQAECAFRQGRIEDGRTALQERQKVQDDVLRQLRAKHNAGMEALLREAQLATELRARNADLRLAYDEMEQRVRERSAELAEAQQALNRHAQRGVVSKLLIGVAHQLNTPLGTAGLTVSALRDQLQGLQAQLQSPMRKQDLLASVGQMDDAAALIETNLVRSRSLLSRFSELGLHEQLHQSRRVQLAPWLCEQVEVLQQEWLAVGVQPDLQLEEGIEWLGAVDALGHVLQHLFRNAMRFARVDGRAAPVSLIFQRLLPGPGLCIEVKDQGPGMSELRRAHAFEPFAEQLVTEGGLGLVLVRNLVEGLMRGQVELRANQPQGLCVRIILPDSATGSLYQNVGQTLSDRA